jgi:hypothetical protein
LIFFTKKKKKKKKNTAPYLVATILSFLVLVSLTFFRETLTTENRVSFKWKDSNPVTSLIWLLKTPLAWIPVRCERCERECEGDVKEDVGDVKEDVGDVK